MLKNYLLYLLPFSIVSLFSLNSCEKVFEPENYEAYFGGEIINPQDKYVLFLKDDKVLDTIYLDKNNRFFHKFDSLAPGLYTFKHIPEYQYIYFDKNDSLMIRLNANDFDNSLAFCGRGDEKNNFLVDLFLKNQADRTNLYNILDKPEKEFSASIDSSYNKIKSYYLKKKVQIGWNDDFDKVAEASVNFNYFYKKELYPYAHNYKTGECILKELPENFYDYRKNIEYNNSNLANFSPFIKFITAMLNNVSYKNCKGKFDELSLENNITKLNIADTLIKNNEIKNVVLNNIAYMYLLEDQNMYNNKKFIDAYLKLSTDTEQQNEVRQIYTSIQNLKVGNHLPIVTLKDSLGNTFNLDQITKSKRETVIFFWTSHAESHIRSVHKKVMALQEKHPNINFIGVNINDTQENWLNELKKFKFKDVTKLRSSDFIEIKKQWVITKIHRTIILNSDGTIKNAFANLFDVNFEKDLTVKQ